MLGKKFLKKKTPGIWRNLVILFFHPRISSYLEVCWRFRDVLLEIEYLCLSAEKQYSKNVMNVACLPNKDIQCSSRKNRLLQHLSSSTFCCFVIGMIGKFFLLIWKPLALYQKIKKIKTFLIEGTSVFVFWNADFHQREYGDVEFFPAMKIWKWKNIRFFRKCIKIWNSYCEKKVFFAIDKKKFIWAILFKN